MARIEKRLFEKTKAGIETELYTITNAQNASVTICSFGGIVTSLIVPDKNGTLKDVVLGYEHIAGYEEADAYFGALIGRFGNRIAKGRFALGGTTYQLAVNDGENHLHGGMKGFDSRFWEVKTIGDSLHLMLESEDMEENYPGNLKVEVVYSLDDNNCLEISYHAISDKDTVINLTNHMYFNLNGHDSGTVNMQMMKLYASAFTPTDGGSIPTGEIRQVAETPFDFREYKNIFKDIEYPCEQIRFAGGFDHNFVLDKEPGVMAPAAEAYSEESGITMFCETTQPGIQFYTGNYISGEGSLGKGGISYGKRHGFCLETQNFPDAVNHDDFPSAVLKAGEKYHEVTRYTFGVAK